MFVAYLRTFARLGLKSIPMRADTGPIGGDLSHEFIILADTGESEVFCHATISISTVPGDGRRISTTSRALQAIVDKWTSLYAATSEKHDAAAFAALPADKQVSRARHRGRPHLLFRHQIFRADEGAWSPGRTAPSMPVHMGSYGIGPIAAGRRDHRGLPRRGRHQLAGGGRAVRRRRSSISSRAMPRPMPPASSSMRALDRARASTCSTTTRDERPGAKFATADLIGLPWQIMVGPKGLADGQGRAETPRRRQPRTASSRRRDWRSDAACGRWLKPVWRFDAGFGSLGPCNCQTACIGVQTRAGSNRLKQSGEMPELDGDSWPTRPGPGPFAPFEWMLSLRYLRARRQEGFISVIAGFSFLGIMLGVATLIIVMAVMNGFRKELLDKILGLNGHLLVQPLEVAAHRLGRRSPSASSSVAGRPACGADRRGPGARRPRRSTRRGVLVRGIRAGRSRASSARSPTTSSRARSTASTRARASRSGGGSPTSSRCARATTSRWSRRAAR